MPHWPYQLRLVGSIQLQHLGYVAVPVYYSSLHVVNSRDPGDVPGIHPSLILSLKMGYDFPNVVITVNYLVARYVGNLGKFSILCHKLLT